MESISPWISQAGLGIVAALLGWWSWHLWNKMNEDRTIWGSREKEYRDTVAAREKEYRKDLIIVEKLHDEHIQVFIDKLFVVAEDLVKTNDQSIEAIRELRNGFDIYESIQEMRAAVNGRRSGCGDTSKSK